MKGNTDFPSAEGGIHLPEITDGENISQKSTDGSSYQVEDKYNSTINDPLFECL